MTVLLQARAPAIGLIPLRMLDPAGGIDLRLPLAWPPGLALPQPTQRDAALCAAALALALADHATQDSVTLAGLPGTTGARTIALRGRAAGDVAAALQAAAAGADGAAHAAADGPQAGIGVIADGPALQLTVQVPATAEAEPYLLAWLGHWGACLAAAFADPEGTSLSRLPARPAAVAPADAAAPFRPLGPWFSSVAQAWPDRVAVVGDPSPVTYAELDRLSDGLARHLQRSGLRSEDRVALLGRKGVWSVAVMLACVKSGFAYVPVSSTAPAERTLDVLARSGARLVVAPTAHVATLGYPELESGGRQILLANDLAYVARSAARQGGQPLGVQQPDALAYVMYTSGSTGTPKGVGCTHGAVANLAAWFAGRYRLADDNPQVLQLTELGFDPSVEQIFATLLHGGCLHLADAVELAEPDFFDRHPVNIVNATPSVLGSMLVARPRVPSVRHVISGGDALPAALQHDLLSLGYALHNHYGPTETTVDACVCQVRAGAPIAIGRPIGGAQVRVLDSALRDCPPGVAGEIHIGGAGVARGYLDDAALTAAAFLPDPRGGGARLYRSGDVGFIRFDGDVELLGRRDQMVKIAGARVNPAELQRALLALPGVRAAVARSVAAGASGAVLAALVTGPQPLDAGALRDALARQLPPELLPARLHWVPELPTDANGKIAWPQEATEALASYVAPRTEFERDLAAIWQDVLGAERIGIHDDFIALGGNSLQAARVVYRIYESFGVNLALGEFFMAGTLQATAQRIEQDLLADVDADALKDIVTLPSAEVSPPVGHDVV